MAEVKIGVLLVELHKDGEGDLNQEALQVLADLFRTILHSARNEHPHEVFEMAQKTISSCLEEYYEGYMIPIPLLDELLICIGQGPIVLVTNPGKAAERAKKKKSSKALPPHQVEQENPAYAVATAVVRKTVDRLSTPIANLLNGLLNGDRRMVDESSILTKPPPESSLTRPQQQDQSAMANVWAIIYEFHRIAPSILTTVVGTLANYLTSPELEQRFMVVKLLGRLFCGANAKLALQFRPCFREWLIRTNDIEPKIRLIMVEYLLKLIPVEVREIAMEAQHYLVKPLTDDASLEVRLRTLHGLCDIAHRHRNIVAADLWQLVGTRVSAKHRQERKDAITGLAQNYFSHYISHNLAEVQAGGDDCPLNSVQKVLGRCSDRKRSDYYRWIPVKVFEAASFTDAIDPDMHSRVVQVVDELLLGSELPHSSKRLTATARAVGLAVLIHSLKEDSANSYSWMCDLLRQRSRLQKALKKYMESRSQIGNQAPGSEEAFTADAMTLDLLESVASLTAPPAISTSLNPGERNPVLTSFHKMKDETVFRLLSSVSDPTHTGKARTRAFDEISKRVKKFGEATLTWTKTLARRCSMGDFLNREIIRHCILLAQECFKEEDIESCQKFLSCVQVAAETFPEICSDMECFGTLTELFVACRSVSSSDRSKVIGDSGIVTALSTILCEVSPYAQLGSTEIDKSANEHLLSLSCRDGTPEQARHAVSTIAALHNRDRSEALTQEHHGLFTKLLQNLTSPAKLTLAIKERSAKLVTILVALAELTQHAPSLLESKRGQTAMGITLDMVLLGHAHSSAENGSSDKDDEIIRATPNRSKRGRSHLNYSYCQRRNLNSSAVANVVEDSSLSVACRTLCAAMDFLVSFVRASILFSKESAGIAHQEAITSTTMSSAMIERLFETLSQIVQEHGLPPSSHDRRECRSREDHAALRQCASLYLLRLCDPRLGLDQKFLTTERWHVLAGAFLDDESAVRGAVMKELSLMMTGHGKFGKIRGQSAMAPLLRLVAFVVLCVDGDQAMGHATANGNAANVGRMIVSTKAHAKECIAALRKAYEITAAQARANGPDAEKMFESKVKVALMPEFIIPYAMHLLAFRPETPLAVPNPSGVTQLLASTGGIDEIGQRVLRKRLKGLFDPVVLSLGDSADNISFLLRMTELIGKYDPIRDCQGPSIEAKHFLPLSSGEGAVDEPRCESARLQAVCMVAREVLLSYVKKDVNLAAYPGKISFPGHLFRRRATSGKTIAASTANKSSFGLDRPLEGHTTSKRDGHDSRSSSRLVLSHGFGEPGESLSSKSSAGRAQVHFGLRSPPLSSQNAPTSFGGLSPIPKASPTTEAVLFSSGEKTRGTTPPSAVCNTRFTTSALSTMDSNSTIETATAKGSETTAIYRLPVCTASTEDSATAYGLSRASKRLRGSRKRSSVVEHLSAKQSQHKILRKKPDARTQLKMSGSRKKGKENKTQPNAATKRRKTKSSLLASK
eukprot:scaffold1650_cov135-Cylindrotheca_fusiformis.AAC.5